MQPPGGSPVAETRVFILDGAVVGIRGIPPEIWRGELGYLVVISPTIRRLELELIERQATALADVISETTAVTPEVARLHGIARAGVFQIIISEAGRRTHDGQKQNRIAGHTSDHRERPRRA